MFYRIDNNGNDYVGGITAEDVSYEHVQTDASDEWIVIHNLGKYPSVSIRDADGYETHAGIKHTSKNSLIIHFANAETGIAVCN
jgi:hypothetical protein